MANRKLIVEIIGDSRSLDRAFGQASRSARRFNASITGSLSGVGRSLGIISGAAGVAGLAVSLKSATSAAASFESTMQKVVGLSGVAQGKIGGLSDQILKLAPQVGKGPQELAEGLQFITSSGIDAEHAMAVLDVSARAAAAGLGETKVVADAVTSVMNAYGSSVVNAQRATDVLVATVREGKGEADEFAGVIGNVTAISSQLGVSFEDVGAALAAMTRLGTDAETSATQLQRVFTSLVKVTPQQEKAFKAVGLSAAGLRKELKEQGLLATLRTIQTAFAGNLPGLSQAFGDLRALRGVLSLVGNQAQETEGIFRRMSNSAGSLSDAFKAIGGTSAQQFARFNAAVDTTRITIGAALAPAAEKAASAIADWLSVSKNQERVQRDVESAVQRVTNAARTMADVLKDIRDVLEPTVRSMGGLGNAIKIVLSAMVATKVVAFATSITGLGTASAASAGKVNLLRGALLRLGAIGVVTLGVEVLLNKDAIDKKVNEFLTRNHLGFLTAQPKKIPIGVDVTDLDKARQALLNMGQAGDLGERSLKQVADRLRQVGTEANKALDAASKVEGFRSERAGRGNAISAGISKALDFVQKQTQTALQSAQDGARKQAVTAKRAAAIAKKAATEQRKAFDSMIDSLGLKVDRAAATKGFADDLKANAELQAAIRKQIVVGGNTTDLATQLFQAQQARAQILADQATAAANARAKAAAKIQASQFKALGLTGEGDARTPGVPNLKKQLAQITDRLGPEVTPKIQSQLAAIGKVLSGAVGKVTVETRKKILELFQTIRSTFDQETKGPLTTGSKLDISKISAGLGLSGTALKELQGRLSRISPNGTVAVSGRAAFGQVIPVGTQAPGQVPQVVLQAYFDGQAIEPVVTRQQQRKATQTSPQTRGRFSGR